MSSIDKGVENVVREMGRNVRVVHRGSYIVGLINGEEVFCIADRYGYIDANERAQVINGIRRYDANRAAREEALRRAREEEERLRREREEAERKAEYRSLQNAIAVKNTEIAKDAREKREAYTRAKHAFDGVRADIDRVQKGASEMDFSALQRECDTALAALDREYEKFTAANGAAQRNLDAVARSAKESQTTQQSRTMKNSVSRIHGTSPAELSSYEATQLKEKVTGIEEGIRAIKEISSVLRKLAEQGGEVAIIAQEALSRIKGAKISSVADLTALTKRCQAAAQRILEVKEAAENAAAAEELGEIISAIEVCEQLYVASENSTYSAKDYRKEIVESALAATRGFLALREKGYTTCSDRRIAQVVERCGAILTEGGVGESVMEETRRMVQELEGYEQADKLHAKEYEDYCAMTEELASYGVSRSELPSFNATGYAEQRKLLSAKLRECIREAEISNMILTDLTVRGIMEEMGYEVFSTIGDKEGYVIETLYTRKGYDGVLWQVITMSDGSIQRRLIGVNKGDTQTDPESVKEVAREMEEKGEPEAFLRAYGKTVKGGIRVTDAVDHDSEDADEAIRRNGYHHLSPQARELYDSCVAGGAEIPVSYAEEGKVEAAQSARAKRPATKARQVKTTAQNAIQSSSSALRNAAAQSRAMSRAN